MSEALKEGQLSSVSYDFGPGMSFLQSECVLDQTLAGGLYAVTSGGSFDYLKGGHFVLKQAGLVLQFPPLTTLILSPTLTRWARLPVNDGEWRISLMSR
jgi:hypothetical protein